MSPDMDTQILAFDIWETLDQESMELTQTSEFWTQVQYEADRLDLVPPNDFQDLVPENETDWRIEDTQPPPPEEEEEEPEHKENIVHHDCMWAGSCADSVHPGNTFVPSDFTPVTQGQSLLRRDNMSPPRPETPPSIDGDEPPQFRHAVDVAGTALRLLRDSAAVAADHSYTCRQQFDNLGVQTPSDSCESEEEIDVVSVGTSSDTLQSPHSVCKSEVLPRAASVQEQQQYAPRALSAAASPRSPRGAAGRKRAVPPAATPRRRARGPARRGRRSNTDTESEAEAPEIERRSIHNDMERLRRIGLKNLFDELKKQIPATRDKERAPKVVILREAATLCRKLREEDVQREKLKKEQVKLIAKLRKLRMLLSSRYRSLY